MSSKIEVRDDGKGKYQSFMAAMEDFQSETNGHYQIDLTAYGATEAEAKNNLMAIIEKLMADLRALLAARLDKVKELNQ